LIQRAFVKVSVSFAMIQAMPQLLQTRGSRLQPKQIGTRRRYSGAGGVLRPGHGPVFDAGIRPFFNLRMAVRKR
jgi:hypothetical protein